ncbi:MAG: hypothetical protein GEV09_14935 [Pseudonocardiaceae bacterium]|nr:hypothetical protein [Pseudonocardiaceae bacterium]
MPPPFVAYLRVYQPLHAFDDAVRPALQAALDAGPVEPADAGGRERELWLRAQLAVPPRLLPAERADGSPSRATPDVLALDPADVPQRADAPVAAGPLVCPLDVRLRAAAALLGFVSTSSPALLSAALPVTAEAARGRAQSVLTGLEPGEVHMLSSTWRVPLPWFALVDPPQRHLDAAPRPDPARRVCWRVAMADARRRVSRAHDIVVRNLGEDGPAAILADTGRWLGEFDPQSAVELDYGGLVHLMDDEALHGDTSAADVHTAVEALQAGDADQVARSYEQLRDFWDEVAAAQDHG